MDIDAIVQWLIDFVTSIAQYLVQIAQYIWTVLVQVANFLWGVLQEVFHYAWSFLKSAIGLVRSLWDNFFKKIFTAVWGALQKAQAWLEEKLSPIIDFFKKLRAIYDRWFKEFIKPLLNFLQMIRHIIEIFKLLHIHILDGLDKAIAKIEGKIVAAVMTIRGVLNNVIDLLSLIADPLNIIRRPTLVYSFRRVFLSSIRVFTGLPPGYFIPSPRGGAKKGLGFLPSDFNSGDPSQNPPASSYSGNDGIPSGWDGFVPGVDPADADIDALLTLDYFDDTLYPDPTCLDPLECWQQAFDQFTGSKLIG